MGVPEKTGVGVVNLGIAAVAGLLAWQGPVPGGDIHILIVSGIGGQPQYSDAFHSWGVSMVDAARDRLKLPLENINYLAERPDRDPDRIQGRSTKENVERVLAELEQRVGPTDRVFILLIGHGSANGEESRFNLPGPDITAAQFAEHLDKFPTQMVVLANTSSASGDFVSVLSGPNRVILTATKTGFERNETIFGRFFVEAFAQDGADVDKDERISVLEAFNYARLQVARTYEADKRLLTEHAVLDDNGDGEGSTEPDPDTSDGALARALFLDRLGNVAAGPAGGDSVLVALYKEKREIETQIQALRKVKDQIGEEDYEAQLEELLVRLALKNREVRTREEGR